MRGGCRSAGELNRQLRGRALTLCPDPRRLWEFTAAELYELCEAREIILSELYGANEYLAFNTAALSRTAFNAPQSFPLTPRDAFPKKPRGWREAKAEMMKISDASLA